VQIVLGKPAWHGAVPVADQVAGTALHGEAAG
jgi:hypothetical protein